MENKENLLQEIKNAATGKISEHIINIFKAAVATAPFCGGIASLMSDYIPSTKFRRLEAFTKQIVDDLQKLQDSIEAKTIETNEFAFIFEQCFRGVAENYQKEKIEAFRGILINSAINNNLTNYEKEYFLNLVNTFSILHIRMLKFMARPIEYLNENKIPSEQIQGGFSNFFQIAIPGVDIELIKSAFGELYQYGFLNTNTGIFVTTTSNQGLQLLGNRTTDLAKKFINFCTIPEKK